MSELSQANKPKSRRNLLMLCFIAFIAAAIAVGFYMANRPLVSTEDAYVVGDKIIISAKISGTVSAVTASDTQYVKQKQSLVQLDRSELTIKREQAEAELASIVRNIKSKYHLIAQLKEQIIASEHQLNRLSDDLKRRIGGDSDGTVTSEDLQHSKQALQIAKANHRSLLEELKAQTTLLPEENLTENPSIKLALAKLQAIYLDLIHSNIISPSAGFIAQRSVQAGERIRAGEALMAVVPLDNVWVEANFKETQLGDIRVGQEVELHSDIYGKKVTYQGIVAGIGAGTGSVFSALPAENATGNWIKVVQRVPVKIYISHDQLEKNPLRIGGSMGVEVNTSSQKSVKFDQKIFQLHDNTAQIYQKQQQEASLQAKHFLNHLLGE